MMFKRSLTMLASLLIVLTAVPWFFGTSAYASLPEFETKPESLLPAEAVIPTITKNPTGETVIEGGSAVFIARADGADKLIWRLVNSDATITVPVTEAPAYFSGLLADGDGTEKLTLSSIPLELDGWMAECLFVSDAGTVFSMAAPISVKKAQIKCPSIKEHSGGVELNAGASTQLSVTAESEFGTELSYQWYQTDTNSNIGGDAIPGAVGRLYIPTEQEGKTYYYAAVWATKGEEQSAAVYTGPIPVTWLKSRENEAEAVLGSSIPVLSTQVNTVEEETESDSYGRTMIIAGLILCAVAAVVSVTALNAKRGRGRRGS